MTADPKPAARIVNRDAGTNKLLREGRCRLCGGTGGAYAFYITRHHLIKKSQGGDDIDANIVPLCGHGTAGCHGDVEAYRGDARQRLRHKLQPEEVLYIVAKESREWLNTHYPK